MGRTTRAMVGVGVTAAIAWSAAQAYAAEIHVDGRIGDWTGEAPWIAGQAQYSNGEWIYQDYIDDDYGAAVPAQHPPQESNLPVSYTSGTYRYPTDEARYGNNSADLRQLRLALTGHDLDVLVALNTLKAPDTTVAAIGFDVDHDAATGGGPWPFSAGISTPGTDVVLTLWGSGGALTDLRTGKTEDLSSVGGRVAESLDDNAIEASVPRALLGGGDEVGVRFATGIWDAAAHQWMAVPSGQATATTPGYGSSTIPARAFNVGPRPAETGSYLEDRQAAALASGDLTPFVDTVEIGKLASNTTELAPITPGFHEGVMRQDVTIPPANEGMSYSNCVPGRSADRAVLPGKFCFFGPYQPFGIYLPSTYDGKTPLPMALALHGYGGSHSTYNSEPGFLHDMGETPPTVLLTPLARGPGGFYIDYAEKDTFETLDFVEAHVPIDRDRLYLTGYSMGGYGVFRLGSMYPDMWAAAVSWAGFTGELVGTGTDEAQEGDTTKTLEGFLHIPVLQLGGTNDEIVPVSGQLAASRRLDQLGYVHRFDLYPGYEHLSFGLVDKWDRARAWLGNQTVVRRPAHIAYRFGEAWGNPALGLSYGNAYWLHDMRLRDLSATDGTLNAQGKAPEMRVFGSVDADSLALPERTHTTQQVDQPEAGPPPYVETGIDWVYGPSRPTSNQLNMTLTNLKSITVDAPAAGLRDDVPLTLDITTDGPATVTLDGIGPEDVTTVNLDAAGDHVIHLP